MSTLPKSGSLPSTRRTLGKVPLSVTTVFTLDKEPSISNGRYLCRAPDFGTRQRSYFAEWLTFDTR